jgi:two-component system, LuxR family, sensor kinase FixL
MADREHFSDLSSIKKSDFYTTHAMTSSRVWMKVGQVMSKEVLSISPNESVASAAMAMSKNNISCILVVENEEVRGILTEEDLLKKAIVGCKHAHKMAVTAVMSSPVETVSSDFSVLAASRIMEAKHIKRLPVMAENKLVGIVTQTDLTRVLTYYGTWRDISEIMSKDISGVQKNTTVAEAASIMTSRHISSIAVMAGKQVVGILTERDLLSRVVALRKDPNNIKTETVMSSPVISVPPSYSVFSASKTMENLNIRRLVVMEDKKLLGIVTQTDIFAAIKDKLQTEEEKNLKLLEESKSAIYTTDLDYKIIYANPAFIKLFEISDPGEFINQPFLPEQFWFDPKEREQFLAELKADCFESKELTLKTLKGKKIYVTIFSTFVKGIHGETIGSQGIVYDITAKKELSALRVAEEALRESEQKWRSLAENIPDVIFTVGRDGRIQFLNHIMAGIAPENVIGASIYEYVQLDQQKIMRESIERVFQTAQIDCYEINMSNEQGSETIWETRVVPIIHGNQVVAVNLISMDVTERRKSERRQAELLEQLESINSELKDFANIVSHDLKAPLQGIQTVAQWISEDYASKLDEKAKEQLDLLLSRTNCMHNLIDGILNYSRVGQLSEQKERINLNELVSQIIDMVSPPANITILIENELPVIESEKTRITQIFQNLLSNAIKYIDKPQGRIKINGVEEDDCWKFSIADNGPGIKEEHFEKIFQMFKTLSPRDTFESTGIGLALVKKIVEIYGGAIWVESEVGEGSTFFFTLPKQIIRAKSEKLEASIAR